MDEQPLRITAAELLRRGEDLRERSRQLREELAISRETIRLESKDLSERRDEIEAKINQTL